MSDADKWLFGFITLWIVLTAGTPDLLDAMINRVGGWDVSHPENCVEVEKNEQI